MEGITVFALSLVAMLAGLQWYVGGVRTRSNLPSDFPRVEDLHRLHEEVSEKKAA